MTLTIQRSIRLTYQLSHFPSIGTTSTPISARPSHSYEPFHLLQSPRRPDRARARRLITPPDTQHILVQRIQSRRMSTSNLPVDARPARSAQSSEAGGAGAGESRKPFVCGTLTPQQLADQSGTSGSPMQKQAAASETLSSIGSSEAETVRDSAKPTGLVMQIILRRDLLTVRPRSSSPPYWDLVVQG